jgi:glycosyltransferase involved in cell wall biosynthesis
MPEPIAVVLPWYGPDTAGGAEAHARELVAALHQAGVAVEVWTTTARDAAAPLAPYYPSGDSELDGVRVRRFSANLGACEPIRRRWASDFVIHELNLLQSLAGSDELLECLARERDTRRWVFFLYAFPTSFWGAQIAGERGYLVPCLHDEPYARYGTTRYLLRTVRHVLANSAPERDLIAELTGGAALVSVVGEGIDLGRKGDGERFRRTFGVDGPFVFYVGRRDHTKNFPQLLTYWGEYIANRGSRARLVVAGAGPLHLTRTLQQYVVDVGFVSAQSKHDGYAAADVFCMPGLYESFSIVMMEAWLQGTPCLVHAACAVTVDFCRRSDGGLWFGSYRRFEACLDRLLDDRVTARRLGAQGREWVMEHCNWADVVKRLLVAMGD